MINVSQTIKNSCKADKNTHTEYIVINGQTIYISGKLSATAYKDTTFFGTFNMKVLQFETENSTQFRNREFEYYKVIDGNAFKVGSFITTQVVDNDSSESVKVTANDYALKFAIPYTSQLDYDSGNVKLYDVLKECCDNAGVELENEFITNGTFVVDSNQFVNGEMIGDVICAIAGISGNFATIAEDDKLKLTFLNGTGSLQTTTIDGSSTINASELKDIEIKAKTTQETTTGKNLLNIAITGSGSSNGINYTINKDNSITLNGTATATFYLNLDNVSGHYGHFTNGQKYTSYLKNAGNNIKLVTRYVSDTTASLYTSFGDQYGIHTYTGITDKDNFSYITIPNGGVVNNVTVYPMIVKGEYNLQTIGNYEPYTYGASPNPNYPQEVVNVTGRQEVKCVGKNLYNSNDTTYYSACTYVSGANTNQYKVKATGTDVIINAQVASGSSYSASAGTLIPCNYGETIYYDIGNANFGKNFITQYNSNKVSLGFTALNTGYSSGSYTPTNSECKYISIRIGYGNATSGTEYTLAPIISKSSNLTYEPYQEQVNEINLGKNLFDKDNATILNAYFGTNTLTSDEGNKTTYIKCSPNTTYTISKTASKRFAVAYTKVVPAINTTIYGKVNGYDLPSITITTGSDALYLVVWLINSNLTGEITLDEAKNTLQIEKGTQATSYSEYFTPIELCKIGNYEDKIFKNSGKNLFDGELEQGGIASGSPTSTTTRIRSKNFTTLSSGYHTISASNNSNFYVVAFVYDMNDTYISGESYPNWLSLPNTINIQQNRKVKLAFRNASNTDITPSDIQNVQLEKGSTATDYEPYGNGEWYVKKNIGKYTFTGNDSENWSYLNVYDNNYLFQAVNVNIPVPNASSNYLCTHAIPNSATYSTSSIGSYFYNNIFRLRVPSTIATTTGAFKTWVGSNNVSVYYPLTTPTYEKLNDELQVQLSDIKTMPLLNGINNITTTAPFDITYIDNNIEILEDYTDLDDKRDTQPITSVSIGTSQVEGQEAVLKDEGMIALYGEHWLILNDNPFAYTLDKRQELITALFNKVKGFGYSSFTSKYTYRPYLSLGDKIKFRNKAGNLIDSAILRYEMNFDDCTFEAPSITSASIDYEAIPSTEVLARRAEIIANQAEAQISVIATEQDDLEGRVETAEGKLTSAKATLTFIEENTLNEDGSVKSLSTPNTTNTTTYTFDKNGIKIGKSTDNYNSLQDNTGTYYYEKGTMIGKYTKDGSVQKDLALFGKYYYGIDEDDPNFNVRTFTVANAKLVAQWYDNGSEEGFGHFWNGE